MDNFSVAQQITIELIRFAILIGGGTTAIFCFSCAYRSRKNKRAFMANAQALKMYNSGCPHHRLPHDYRLRIEPGFQIDRKTGQIVPKGRISKYGVLDTLTI